MFDTGIFNNNKYFVVDGFPDLTDSKAYAQTVALNHALTLSNVETKTHAHVEKLATTETLELLSS